MPILVKEQNAPPETRRIYDDIKKTLGIPFLNTSYINFGRWPDFLLANIGTRSSRWFSARKYEQNRVAIHLYPLSALAAELPQPLQLSPTQLEEAGVSESDLSAITQVTEFFLQILSKQLLNIAFAKIGLEGGAHSTAAA